ncbi:hypothetical protein Hanom_Chr10g00880711 [Helianthus anomalus]
MVGSVVVLCMYGCLCDSSSNPLFNNFFLVLNFNTIFQIITLGPFKFNFQLHTFFFLGKRPQNFISS